MQLTRKVRIYPTSEQESVLWTLSDICRVLYNAALEERKIAWEVNKKSINYYHQQNKLPTFKEEHPEFNQVYSKVLQSTLHSLDYNYSSFFTLNKSDPLARPPGFRGKDYFFTMKYNQSGFNFDREKSQIKLSQFVEDVPKSMLTFKIPEKVSKKLVESGGQIAQIDVFQDHKHKWYLSIVYELTPPEYHDNDLHQAWDLGITKHVGVNTSGKFKEVRNIRPDKYWLKPISELQSRRDHCKKRDRRKKNCRNSSKKWVQLNNLKHKCERKRKNQMLDFQHKKSLMIVKNTKANTIVVGKLDVKRMTKSKQSTKKSGKQNKNLNRSTQGAGYLGRFVQLLTYKAERVGKKVIKVDEKFTTQECCCCCKRHKMTLADRVMKCDCGNEIDRDRNSAINIMVNFLSQNAMCTGYQKFSGNLRKTGVDIRPLHSQEAPSSTLHERRVG
jgi:putative transposase